MTTNNDGLDSLPQDVDHEGVFLPTPEQIRDCCRRIRAEWTSEERHRRLAEGGGIPYQNWKRKIKYHRAYEIILEEPDCVF